MQAPDGGGSNKGPKYPTAPGGQSGSGSIPASGGSSGSGGSSSSSGSSGSGGSGGSGGGGGYSYAKAQAKAAARYRRQAENLEAQAKALKHALRVDLKKGLLQQLGDINQVSQQQDKIVRQGFRARMGSLLGAAEDNTKAAEGQTGINQQNLVRERNSALSEAMAQGAGESDALRAMMMSLRNWNANQTEIERGYFDTLRSIQSGQTDLETDTKTALVNNAIQRNSDKEMLWTNYYNQRSEIWTQLGNVRGQQADYYAMAAEMGKGGGVKGATAQAKHAFMQSAKELGKSWDNPGVGKKIMKWDGAPEIEADRSQPRGLQDAKYVSLGEKPEGATLRKWG